MDRTTHVLMALAALLIHAGCSSDAVKPGDQAEVPAPEPGVVEDPGPAPEGQWEPTVDEESPSQSSSVLGKTADPAASIAEDGDPSIEEGPAFAAGQPDQVGLKLQTWDETEKLIASHLGKVVVVDFWATSCLPCRREFPHLVALQNAHPDEVACISVSLDYSGRKSRPPESYRDDVLKFLQETTATIDNVLSTDDPDQLDQRLSLPPIPLVWVFSRTGERLKTFDNSELDGDEFTYESDVRPFVEGLLSGT